MRLKSFYDVVMLTFFVATKWGAFLTLQPFLVGVEGFFVDKWNEQRSQLVDTNQLEMLQVTGSLKL